MTMQNDLALKHANGMSFADVLALHAHLLAEKIRTTDLPEIHVDMFDNGTQWAADLIDPEVRR